MNSLWRPLRFALAGLFASGLLAAGPSDVARAATFDGGGANEMMLINAKTGKCLTIAGGVSTQNNVEAVQFD